MRIKAVTSAALVMLASGPGRAEGPRIEDRMGPPEAVAILPAYQIATIVRSAGLVPTAKPVRAGEAYNVRAIDGSGSPVLIVVDARYGDILLVRSMVGPPPSPYGPYPHGPYPRAGGTPPDFYDGPPHRPMPNDPRLNQPPGHAAAVSPVRPPVPRARPATAPPAEPIAAKRDAMHPDARSAAPPEASEPSSTGTVPAKPAAPTLPPVAPLE